MVAGGGKLLGDDTLITLASLGVGLANQLELRARLPGGMAGGGYELRRQPSGGTAGSSSTNADGVAADCLIVLLMQPLPPPGCCTRSVSSCTLL